MRPGVVLVVEDVPGHPRAGVGVVDVSVRRALNLVDKATDLALACAPVVLPAAEEGAVELLHEDGAEGGRQNGIPGRPLAQDTEPCIWCLPLHLQVSLKTFKSCVMSLVTM